MTSTSENFPRVRVLEWRLLDRHARRCALARPELGDPAALEVETRAIIDRVKREGDTALLELTRTYDAPNLKTLAVEQNEFLEARRALTREAKDAIRHSIANVTRFHEAQRPSQRLSIETESGVLCEQYVLPLGSVGLYVPGGAAPLLSTVVMLSVPARLAGCAQRVICTPPRQDGTIHPALLYAAHVCEVDAVFKVGGPHAVAALAYGTDTIPKNDKIFGPGSARVMAAKLLVARDPHGAPCDLPAGPSEVLIVADASARSEFVAADLLAQAEHDPHSQSILVTDSSALAESTLVQLQEQVLYLSRTKVLERSLQSCRVILVTDLESAIEISNDYAPEHLILNVSDPRRWLERVRNAGSVFLGAWSPETLGDYCSGTNHVLPTYGYARAESGLTLRDFQKTISVQEVSPSGLESLGPTAITLANLENLDGHANAVTTRLARLQTGAESQSRAPESRR
jgi:histidinol dehydrogenase